MSSLIPDYVLGEWYMTKKVLFANINARAFIMDAPGSINARATPDADPVALYYIRIWSETVGNDTQWCGPFVAKFNDAEQLEVITEDVEGNTLIPPVPVSEKGFNEDGKMIIASKIPPLSYTDIYNTKFFTCTKDDDSEGLTFELRIYKSDGSGDIAYSFQGDGQKGCANDNVNECLPSCFVSGSTCIDTTKTECSPLGYIIALIVSTLVFLISMVLLLIFYRRRK